MSPVNKSPAITLHLTLQTPLKDLPVSALVGTDAAKMQIGGRRPGLGTLQIPQLLRFKVTAELA